MAYTNNVPQGNQTIASTTDPIRANFAFLDTSVGTEHNFDITDASKTYHLQASMPNKVSDPVGPLPVGTNGMYYVKGGGPKFYNGTDAFTIQTTNVFQNSSNGSFALPGSGSGFSTMITLPQNSVGTFYIFNKGTAGSSNILFNFGSFATNTNSVVINNILVDTIQYSTTALQFNVKSTSVTGRTVQYLFIYWQP